MTVVGVVGATRVNDLGKADHRGTVYFAQTQPVGGGLLFLRRELRHRPESERSPRILEHERRRGERMVDVWEHQVGNPRMRGPLNRAQITLACALQYTSHVLPLTWRNAHPKLVAWLDDIARWPSIATTAPHVSP